MGSKSAFYSDSGIVKDNIPGNATKVLKGSDHGIQKTLKILPKVGNDKRCAAVAHPGAKQIDFCPLTAKVHSGFSPVYLDRIPGLETKRDIHFSRFALCAHFMYRIANGGLAAGKTQFLYQTAIDSSGCVVLLFYAFCFVCVQAACYELDYLRR